MNERKRQKQNRNKHLRRLLQIALICDHIIDCAKVRLRHGRCNVTLGKYQTAAEDRDKKYALFINGKEHFFRNTDEAVRRFLRAVGHKTALAAYNSLEGP